MKKLFAIILALVCCLSLMACSSGETIPGTTKPSQTQQSTKPSVDNATQATNTPHPIDTACRDTAPTEYVLLVR